MFNEWNVQIKCFEKVTQAEIFFEETFSKNDEEQSQSILTVFCGKINDSEIKHLLNSSSVKQFQQDKYHLNAIVINNENETNLEQRYQKLGLNGFIKKPFSPRLFKQFLHDVSHKDTFVIGRCRPDSEEISEENEIRLSVLLAEDNLVNQMVAKTLLQKAGCEVDVVENGQLTVDAWQKGSYDAIFMDCQMPVMDGYEATEIIREIEQEQHISIVALTANAMDGEQDNCYAAGMDKFLTKPINVAHMHQVLQEIALELK